MLAPIFSMTSWEFAYWLQGALEIGEPSEFTIEQIDLIRRQVAVVEPQDRYALTIAFILDRCVQSDIVATLNKIQYDIFVHEIDPSYEGDQEFLHAVHRGEVDHVGNAQ